MRDLGNGLEMDWSCAVDKPVDKDVQRREQLYKESFGSSTDSVDNSLVAQAKGYQRQSVKAAHGRKKTRRKAVKNHRTRKNITG